MLCQACDREAPTKAVRFSGVVGCVLIFWVLRSASPLCKSCVHRHFWEYTLLTALGGWWSITSLLFTPFVLLANVCQYVVCCLTLAPTPPGAARPELTPEALERLRPFKAEIDGYRRRGINVGLIASRVAPAAGVTPGQVMLFIWSTRHNSPARVDTGYVVELPA